MTRNPNDLIPHPLIRHIPRPGPGEPDFEALASDIAAHGIQHPIIIDGEGRVLDGETRRQVALHLGLEAVPVEETEQPAATVVARELALRRKLTKGQTAYLLVPVLESLIRTAPARKKANLRHQSLDVNSVYIEDGKPDTIAAAAASYGISRKLLYQAIELHEMLQGRDEIRQRIERSLFDAERPAGLGACIAAAGSLIAQAERAEAGIRHEGGRPQAVERQFRLMAAVIESSAKRLTSYFLRWDPDTQSEFWRATRVRALQMADEERKALAEFHARIAQELRRAK